MSVSGAAVGFSLGRLLVEPAYYDDDAAGFEDKAWLFQPTTLVGLAEPEDRD